MNLTRSRGGNTIHKPDCRFAADAADWRWAQTRGLDQVLRACRFFGFQACLACKPFDEDQQ
jgi:hypothetical protein